MPKFWKTPSTTTYATGRSTSSTTASLTTARHSGTSPSTMSEPFSFSGQTGALATMHRKEQVMAPLLQQELGVHILVPQNFNTDEFGTFTRDIERTGDQLSAARLKAEKAMALTGLKLAFASEGSFGCHPLIPSLAYNRELVILLDRRYHLEIVGQATSTATNYSQTQVTNVAAAQAFAEQVGFPTHGLVVMADPQPTAKTVIFKGITTSEQLVEAVTWTLRRFGQAHLETDMRAMHNPTRMKVIAQATQDLIRKTQQRCLNCGYPGFDGVERQPGLPCSGCGLPTDLTLAVLYCCKQCGWQQTVRFPEGQETADPAQCAYCNP